MLRVCAQLMQSWFWKCSVLQCMVARCEWAAWVNMGQYLSSYFWDEHACRSYFDLNPGYLGIDAWHPRVRKGLHGSSLSVMWKRYQDGLQHLAELLVDERPEAWHCLVPGPGLQMAGDFEVLQGCGIGRNATLWIVTLMDPEIPNESEWIEIIMRNLPSEKDPKPIKKGFVLDLSGAFWS